MESLLPFHWQRIYIKAGYRVGVGELMGGRENRPGIVGKDITLIHSGIGVLFGLHPFSSPNQLFSGTDMPEKLLLQTLLENENFKILERPLALIIMIYITE